eukprot:6061820-Amphidinium_carterae.1
MQHADARSTAVAIGPRSCKTVPQPETSHLATQPNCVGNRECNPEGRSCHEEEQFYCTCCTSTCAKPCKHCSLHSCGSRLGLAYALASAALCVIDGWEVDGESITHEFDGVASRQKCSRYAPLPFRTADLMQTLGPLYALMRSMRGVKKFVKQVESCSAPLVCPDRSTAATAQSATF